MYAIRSYYVWKAMHFDFGRSFYFQDQVTTLIGGRLGVTMTLGGLALGFALLIAIPLGVIAAIKRDTWVVITSYSIHYTKLYEATFCASSRR